MSYGAAEVREPSRSAPRLLAAPAVSPAARRRGADPGRPSRESGLSPVLERDLPFLPTWLDLAASGYVEEEFYVSGLADAYADRRCGKLDGESCRTGRARSFVAPVPRRTISTARCLWSRRTTPATAWTRLWNRRHLREGYAWVGVSAQRVGVTGSRGWTRRVRKPDVTGAAALPHRAALVRHLRRGTLGALPVRGRSARRPRDRAGRCGRRLAVGGADGDVLRRRATAGAAGLRRLRLHRRGRRRHESGRSRSSRCSRRPTSRTRRTAARQRRLPPLLGGLRGAAHSGWEGYEYRLPLSSRDLGAAPVYTCTNPPLQPCTTEPGYRGRVRAPRALNRRRGAAAVSALPGVRRHDEGAERARARARRHPALTGRRSDGAEHGLQLRYLVLLVLARTGPSTRRSSRSCTETTAGTSAGSRRPTTRTWSRATSCEADAEENQRAAAQSGVE